MSVTVTKETLNSNKPNLTLNVNVSYFKSTERKFIPRPKWVNASCHELDAYRNTLDTLLGDIHIPWNAIECTNPLCSNHDEHIYNIQLFHYSIVDMCLSATEMCIPHTSDNCNGSHNIAGWNDIVKPFKEASLFWHGVWKDCGSPRNAAIADVMRGARAQYHNVVKQVKQNQNVIKRDKLANALLQDRNRSFWSEIRKSNGKCNTIPNISQVIRILQMYFQINMKHCIIRYPIIRPTWMTYC